MIVLPIFQRNCPILIRSQKLKVDHDALVKLKPTMNDVLRFLNHRLCRCYRIGFDLQKVDRKQWRPGEFIYRWVWIADEILVITPYLVIRKLTILFLSSFLSLVSYLTLDVRLPSTCTRCAHKNYFFSHRDEANLSVPPAHWHNDRVKLETLSPVVRSIGVQRRKKITCKLTRSFLLRNLHLSQPLNHKWVFQAVRMMKIDHRLQWTNDRTNLNQPKTIRWYSEFHCVSGKFTEMLFTIT